MSENSPITGGCACGAVRFEFTGERLLSVNCHCRDCQRATGSGYAPLIVVWNDAFDVTCGTLRFHAKLSDGGNRMERGFCAACGSTLTIYEPHRPKLMFVHVGALDEPGSYRPTLDIFTDSAHAWDVLSPESEKFPKMPPVPEGFGC